MRLKRTFNFPAVWDDQVWSDAQMLIGRGTFLVPFFLLQLDSDEQVGIKKRKKGSVQPFIPGPHLLLLPLRPLGNRRSRRVPLLPVDFHFVIVEFFVLRREGEGKKAIGIVQSRRWLNRFTRAAHHSSPLRHLPQKEKEKEKRWTFSFLLTCRFFFSLSLNTRRCTSHHQPTQLTCSSVFPGQDLTPRDSSSSSSSEIEATEQVTGITKLPTTSSIPDRNEGVRLVSYSD
jgi:hypothetical protein